MDSTIKFLDKNKERVYTKININYGELSCRLGISMYI